jgi:AmiR/NasT family two-component response regulator
VRTADESLELLLPPAGSAQEPAAQAERLRELVSSLLTENEQLRQALDSRIVIEQAKGILAERYRLSVDEAFDLLRRSARNHRMRLHVLAAAVISSGDTPPQISPPGLVR